LWFYEPLVVAFSCSDRTVASFIRLSALRSTLGTAYLPRNTTAIRALVSDIMQFCCNTFQT